MILFVGQPFLKKLKRNSDENLLTWLRGRLTPLFVNNAPQINTEAKNVAIIMTERKTNTNPSSKLMNSKAKTLPACWAVPVSSGGCGCRFGQLSPL